jgi:nitronate monooxygenase
VIANRIVRELGPITDAPPFPTAAAPLVPLRLAAEARGSIAFSQLYAGQSAALAREVTASEVTRELMAGLDRSRTP